MKDDVWCHWCISSRADGFFNDVGQPEQIVKAAFYCLLNRKRDGF